MIEVKNLVKRYGKHEVLCGISLNVKAGEICAVAGIEGAGKTTLADLIAGSIEPDAGEIRLCGVDMAEEASSARQHVGYAAAKPALYTDMTPRAGMKFVAEARGMSARETGDKISAIIKKFGIKDISDTVVFNLSEGARRMVSIAQASFTGAEVIVVDEPTAGLNPKEIIEVRDALAKLREHHAVLLMSRNLTEMCALADRVLVLHEGHIVAEGAANELHRLSMDDGTLRIKVRGAKQTVLDAMKGVQGAQIVESGEVNGLVEVVLSANGDDVREKVFRAVCEKGLVLLDMKAGTKSMDDVLMQLVSEKTVYDDGKGAEGDVGSL